MNDMTNGPLPEMSEGQAREWQAILASYKSKSLLTGDIAGVDAVRMPVYDPQTGRTRKDEILCLAVIPYRVKILIPQTEVWYNENSDRPEYVLRSMAGATTDFVITGVDQEGECCTASRRQALLIRRRAFQRQNPVGRIVEARIMAVGRTQLLAECGGYDVTLSQRDLVYNMVTDLRDQFRPGEHRRALVKAFYPETDKLSISIKETEPHPYDGARTRHPIGSRRASVISGKYQGGVFCRLDDTIDCLCIYSPSQYDDQFHIGDPVIIVVTKFDDARKRIYGRIISKW